MSEPLLHNKTVRERRPLVLEYLKARGATEVRERIANNTHLLIEIIYGGRRCITISNSERDKFVERYILSDLRRIKGPEPKEPKKKPARQIHRRISRHHAQTEAHRRAIVRPTRRHAPNIAIASATSTMHKILRERFASNAAEPRHAGNKGT